jgi:hypothetical protein
MADRFGSEFNNSKKYQCFCCSRQYTDLDEYKDHILKEHEEGRDFVICPLQRCGFPVRCLRTHFKAKHPSEKLPEKGMMKAMVWKDFANGKCKKVKGPNTKTGYHGSTKMGQNFYYRSGWEKEVYELLDQDAEVLSYKAEPFEIPYVYKGEGHKYTPDIHVYFQDGRIELWEIKPANQTLLEQNKAKWTSAEAACDMRGWKFVVITEQMIEKLKKKVANSHRGFLEYNYEDVD